MEKVLLWTLSAAILTAPVYLSGINVTAAPIMQENKTEVDKIKEEKKEPVSGYEEEFQKNNEKVSETMKNKKVSRTAQNESCGETATWALDNGVLTISGTGAIADYSDTSEIPWKDQKKTITKIVIENGITEIGIQAFYDCTNVTEVVFPDTPDNDKKRSIFSVLQSGSSYSARWRHDFGAGSFCKMQFNDAIFRKRCDFLWTVCISGYGT